MERIASFELVSRKRYALDAGDAAESYTAIKLPHRATAHSAGYDFFAPYDVFLPTGGSAVIKTGIRARIAEGWVLMLYPRSGLGFKLGLHLANTVGVIDGDYYNADNEGHIMIKLVNPSESSITLQAGTAFAQGVFVPYGITVDDEQRSSRHGGLGSTGAMGIKEEE